jgi:hypothetical protein
MYKIYVPNKGWLEITRDNEWMCGTYEKATEIGLERAYAARIHLRLDEGTLFFPTHLAHMTPGDLMAMAGLMMTAATTQAQTAIAPMPGSGGGKKIVSMTYPPQYEEAE